MKRVAVEAEGLLKEYHIYSHPMERLKEIFLRTPKHAVFKALGPLDIEIRSGETLGVVGENGAGKSTFLKLVAGVIEPSSGTITVDGRVSSILELGTGFNPEFTGRENIFLNGTLYGLSSGEINERIGGIEKFADIGEFFNMPVKIYSSGMYMRLAFALAVYVDADIIVIDEALAVGDGAYAKKCIDRMWDLKKNGITLLYCSHSLYTVTNFCDRVMWLKGGEAEAIGEAKEVISRYEDYLREKEQVEEHKQAVFVKNSERKIAEIRDIRILAEGNPDTTSVQYSSDIDVVVDFEIFEKAYVYVGFIVDRNDGFSLYANTMHKEKMRPFNGPSRESLTISFKSLPLLGGAYKFVILLMDESGICIFDRKESAFFKVDTSEKEWGACYLPHEWKK
jgi:ABC-type polysaccharide/polyol phosphate transport system ATPase subunit